MLKEETTRRKEMSFTEAIRSVLSNYKDFNGRARRSDSGGTIFLSVS